MFGRPTTVRSSWPTAWNGMSLVWDSQNVQKTSAPAARCSRRDLAQHPALADPRGADEGDHRAVAVDRPVQYRLDGGHFPPPANEP